MNVIEAQGGHLACAKPEPQHQQHDEMILCLDYAGYNDRITVDATTLPGITTHPA